MNLANKITLLRIILIPIIVILLFIGPVYGVWDDAISIGTYTLQYSLLISGILFIIASLTDWLDGYIARKYKMVTTFGKFFDAIADKLLTNAVIIIFMAIGLIPVWMALIIILRDFLIDVVRQVLASSNHIMAANNWGKWKTTFQMIGLTLLFFVSYYNFGKVNEYNLVGQLTLIPMYVATVLSVVSAIIYIYSNRKGLIEKNEQ